MHAIKQHSMLLLRLQLLLLCSASRNAALPCTKKRISNYMCKLHVQACTRSSSGESLLPLSKRRLRTFGCSLFDEIVRLEFSEGVPLVHQFRRISFGGIPIHTVCADDEAYLNLVHFRAHNLESVLTFIGREVLDLDLVLDVAEFLRIDLVVNIG